MMESELKPVRCGCGGEVALVNYWSADYAQTVWYVRCKECDIASGDQFTEAEAVMAWNKAMGERTAKVIEHDASVTDTDGYKYQRSEYLCENCKKKVIDGDDYCPQCGCRLEWE
ncbi:MAG: hypothetical protein IJI07_01165 [Flexilinea sp.]|nr:hypothetical protein [Flexilinea sp.]